MALSKKKKKSAKKIAKKPVKKATKKVAKKATAKSAKKVAKPAKSSAKKPAKKVTAKATSKKATAKAKSSVKATKSKTSAPKLAKTFATPAKPKMNFANKWKDLFTPLDDRIVIEKAGPSDRTEGGLYIPDSVKEKPHRGKVLLVGRGKKNKKGKIRPMDVEVGNEVLFNEFSGTPIVIEGQEVLILREEDLLGIFTR